VESAVADDVRHELRGIGQMARESGLTVSALRFYDRAGLLVPAAVDPDTGYRWYAGEQVAPARLVAGLRRVGMPLAQIGEVLAALPDSGAAHGLVDAHLRRLEDGDALVVEVAGRRVTGTTVPGEFPDHRRLLGDRSDTAERHQVTVDVAALRAALTSGVAPLVTREHAGVPCPVAVLAAPADGELTVVEPSRWGADNGRTVAVNPEFLLQALAAGGEGQLVLDLDGPIRPLVIRAPGETGRFSILMPVRL
jgi:DNA-binding transcriptional MerR regulator